MALQGSGNPISLGDIQNEFGGTNPINISEYYKGGAYVPNISPNTSIPTSGSISLSDFYGSSNQEPLTLIDLAGSSAGVGYSTAQLACGGSSITDSAYWENLNGSAEPSAFDNLYTDPGGTNAFAGNNGWWKYGNDLVLKIDNNGVITSAIDCSQTLTVSPTSVSLGDSSGSFTFAVTSNSTWTVTDNTSWLTVDQSTASGSGNDSSVTVNYTANSGGSRSGSVTVRTTDNFITRSISVSQAALSSGPYEQNLYFSSSSSGDACLMVGGLVATIYTDLSEFTLSSEAYSNSDGTGTPTGGYYSDGNSWIFVDGRNGLITNDGVCGGGI